MYLVTWQLSEFGNQTPPRGTFGHLTAWHIINIERCHQLAFDWQNRALQGRLWRTKGTEMMTTTTTAVMTTTKNCRPRTGTEVCCVIIIFFSSFLFLMFLLQFFFNVWHLLPGALARDQRWFLVTDLYWTVSYQSSECVLWIFIWQWLLPPQVPPWWCKCWRIFNNNKKKFEMFVGHQV